MLVLELYKAIIINLPQFKREGRTVFFVHLCSRPVPKKCVLWQVLFIATCINDLPEVVAFLPALLVTLDSHMGFGLMARSDLHCCLRGRL